MPTVTRDADESKVDMDALARLEALQKRQMVEMFGFDYDQEVSSRSLRYTQAILCRIACQKAEALS